MGFLLQLISNGGSRLVYMYLLGMLNQQAVDYASPHATLLANANGLSALFSLNAYQYYLAQQAKKAQTDLQSCDTQFRLLLGAWVLAAGCMVIWGGTNQQVLPTIVAALALALPELTFTMATALDKPWRAILFYGGQALFFCGYALAIAHHAEPVRAAMYASAPTLVVNIAAYLMLRDIAPPDLSWLARLVVLAQECRIRLGTLIASIPIIATPSAMVYGLNLSSKTSAQIPQMLLFSSFVGAIVFIMGNVFQHYGKSLIPRLLDIQHRRNHKALWVLLLGVFALCLCLTVPVELLLSFVRQSFQHQWAHNWNLYATVAAAGAVILQWCTVISIHHGRTGPILLSNLTYLLLASILAATTLYTDIHVFAILAVCAALRSLINVVEFTMAKR
jgi:hypothetical protein